MVLLSHIGDRDSLEAWQGDGILAVNNRVAVEAAADVGVFEGLY